MDEILIEALKTADQKIDNEETKKLIREHCYNALQKYWKIREESQPGKKGFRAWDQHEFMDYTGMSLSNYLLYRNTVKSLVESINLLSDLTIFPDFENKKQETYAIAVYELNAKIKIELKSFLEYLLSKHQNKEL